MPVFASLYSTAESAGFVQQDSPEVLILLILLWIRMEEMKDLGTECACAPTAHSAEILERFQIRGRGKGEVFQQVPGEDDTGLELELSSFALPPGLQPLQPEFCLVRRGFPRRPFGGG